MNIEKDPLYTIDEAAEALRISKPYFKKIRDENPDIFRPIMVAGRTTFSASQLNRYLLRANPHLTACTVEIAKAASDAAGSSTGGA